MPLKKGKSKKVVSENIKEFAKGKTFSKTKDKLGEQKAMDQAIAVAFKKAGRSKRRKK